METSIQAAAAHMRYNAGPEETIMPSGTVVEPDVIRKLFIASAFLMRTVHIAAPMRRRILLKTAIVVESKKATVCLGIPLINATTAQIEPMSSI